MPEHARQNRTTLEQVVHSNTYVRICSAETKCHIVGSQNVITLKHHVNNQGNFFLTPSCLGLPIKSDLDSKDRICEFCYFLGLIGRTPWLGVNRMTAEVAGLMDRFFGKLTDWLGAGPVFGRTLKWHCSRSSTDPGFEC